MLRPLLVKSVTLAASVFLALSTLLSPSANAIIIVDASVNGGAFETVATSPNNIDAVIGFLPAGITGGITATSTIEGRYPVIQLTSTTIGVADSVIMRMTVTDLDTPDLVQRLLTGYSDTVPTGAATVQVDSFIDAANTPFGTTTPVASGGPVSDPVTTSILTQLGTPIAPPYSLTLINTLTDLTGSANFTSTLAVVPEPGSLGLLGTGLVLAGLVLRRRRSRQA